jgi:dienelactone hydrolase
MVAAAAAAAGVAGCGSSARGISIRVTPGTSLSDEPLHVVVTGLPPRKPVTLALRSTDAAGVGWRSGAKFIADAAGRVDLDTAPARAGSYTGVWGSGLLVSMHYETKEFHIYWWDGKTLRFELSARSGGKTVATTTFERKRGELSVRTRDLTLAENGFIGEFAAPKTGGRHPAILAFGGSEGGNGETLHAALLASHGYPTLSIAYFGEPGLPSELDRIPLEYFRRALEWLRRQPGVDTKHIVTLGISRGSEAALLLGVHYPKLVHGVIAAVPSDAAICGYPDCSYPAWTLGGKALPYTTDFDNPAPTDNPAAVIPVERIKGPIFLACATYDEIWVSCRYSAAIQRRLDSHHFPYEHVLYTAAPPAGHLVGALLPYEPGFVAYNLGTELSVANEKAREQIWPKLLAFLARL